MLQNINKRYFASFHWSPDWYSTVLICPSRKETLLSLDSSQRVEFLARTAHFQILLRLTGATSECLGVTYLTRARCHQSQVGSYGIPTAEEIRVSFHNAMGYKTHTRSQKLAPLARVLPVTIMSVMYNEQPSAFVKCAKRNKENNTINFTWLPQRFRSIENTSLPVYDKVSKLLNKLIFLF